MEDLKIAILALGAIIVGSVILVVLVDTIHEGYKRAIEFYKGKVK